MMSNKLILAMANTPREIGNIRPQEMQTGAGQRRGGSMIKNMLRLIAGIVLVMSLSVSCGDARDVLGPRDKPDLSAIAWDRLKVVYWIGTADSERITPRSFTIVKPADVAALKAKMAVKEISGLSVGTGSYLVFKNGEESLWHGDFCFENTLYLSKTQDEWRSYKFVLSGIGFYDKLRELCAENERQYHPEATSAHIILLPGHENNGPKFGAQEKPSPSP